MTTLRLMLRMLLRDLRAGELTVLLVALTLAVAALTSVGFLADRVGRAVERESRQLLGGDLLLVADHPWSDDFRAAARRQGLQLAESAGFLSMVSSSEGVQLADIKAVSDGYPLRGAMRIAPQRDVGDGEAAGVPRPGTVWPDARLATVLQVDRGLALRVGELAAEVAAIVTLEPDRGINPFALAPRLIINLADLPASGLIQPGSRVSWRLHVAGETAAVEAFRRWADGRLGRGERIEGIDNARPEIRNVIERAQRFLSLAALLTVALAAVAVGMAARSYMRRHLDACAVMRCLGASERQLLAIHGGEFVLLGLAATLAGGLLGYLIQGLLHYLLAGLLVGQLPAPGLRPWLHGLAVGLVLVVGFVVPPLLRLKSVPTLRVLRREWGHVEPLTASSYLLGLACLAGLMFWMAGDSRLGAVVLAGLLLAVGCFVVAGVALLWLIGRLSARWLAGSWRMGRIGLAGMRRRAGATLVQMVALALGLTTLLILLLAQNDLLAAWRARVPAEAPNRFLINIQPEQRPAIAAFFAAAGLPEPRLEPMVRGRLATVNGRPVRPQDYPEERARRLIEREFNLSSRDDLPAGNEVLAGRWHAQGGAMQFSVESGLAETLNLHIGDELGFEVAGQGFAGRVTSLRKLAWDSMRVNFFVITPGGALDGQPTSFITSVYLPPVQASLTTDLVRQFPNLTVIDVASLLQQLQAMLDQVVRAVQLVFVFALLAGLTVLYAALETSSAERAYELAVLRAIGGQRRQLWQVLLVEFLVLGSLAGLLAGAAATGLGVALARGVFHFDYTPNLLLLLTGWLAGMFCAGTAGLVAARRAFADSVLAGLRSA